MTQAQLVQFLKQTLPKTSGARKKLSVHLLTPDMPALIDGKDVSACGRLAHNLAEWKSLAIH